MTILERVGDTLDLAGARGNPPRGVLRREHRRRKRPDDEREHDQPTPVDTDPNAGDPAQLEGRVHE